jgi:hypothetical protein
MATKKIKIETMDSKFTKGEWEYRNDVVDRGFYIETVDKSHQNTFIGYIGGGLQSKTEIEANAKLISSAPEMFCALESSLQMLEQTLAHRNANGVRMGNVFLEATIQQVKDVISKVVY